MNSDAQESKSTSILQIPFSVMTGSLILLKVPKT